MLQTSKHVMHFTHISPQLVLLLPTAKYQLLARKPTNGGKELTDIVISRYKTAKADGIDTTVLKKCIDDINATIAQYQQLIEATKTTAPTTPPPPVG